MATKNQKRKQSPQKSQNRNSKTQNRSRKKLTLPFKITLIGCGIAIIIALVGVIFQVRAQHLNAERAEAARAESQANVDAANKRLEEITKEYAELEPQYNNKKSECASISFDTPDWFQAKTKCSDEERSLYKQLTALETEDVALKNRDYTVYYSLVSKWTYLTWYIIAGSVAGLSILAAFIVYLVKGKKTY